MTYAIRACSCLTLILACGCSNAPTIQTKLVEVVKPAPMPAVCKILRPLVLPQGTTAQGVIEAQHSLILAYEEQVKACAENQPAQDR